MDKGKTIIEKINEIPPLSPVVIEVLNMINKDQNIDYGVLEKKIIKDAGLTGKILSIANSSFYAVNGEVLNVKDACLLLGMNTIRNVVISAAVIERFKNESGTNFELEEVWGHCVCTAAAAKVYAKELGVNEDVAFIAGLLHDLGKIVVEVYLPELYAEVIEYMKHKNCLFIEAEREVLGTDHCKIGAMVANKWRLPDSVIEAIQKHHEGTVASENYDIHDVIKLADVTSHGLGYKAMKTDYLPIKTAELLMKEGVGVSLVERNLSKIEAIAGGLMKAVG